MMPWGHLALGYFVFTVGTRAWYRRAPEGAPTVVLAVGTQAPDLVDKPLNWWFDIYDGRGIGHSLLVVGLVSVVLLYWAHQYDRTDLAAAFSLGAFIHLFGDAWSALLSGNLSRAAYLLWPLYPAPTYPSDSLLDHLQRWAVALRTLQRSPEMLLESQFGIQLLLLFALLAVWAIDGFPGVRTAWRWLNEH